MATWHKKGKGRFYVGKILKANPDGSYAIGFERGHRKVWGGAGGWVGWLVGWLVAEKERA